MQVEGVPKWGVGMVVSKLTLSLQPFAQQPKYVYVYLFFFILYVFIGLKNENELCTLRRDNCDKGLKCTKEDDGCDGNKIGRCKKGNRK